ncbi:hypothetical protein CKM354_000138200 [Cercospora kikuchii]|uniref:FHA domain-containing protein n=1 Tax=Cercospora kikuchii TaxID=84275 RepID=A0A9P3C7R2_9PEZI|nr:uncharacterized protein CKM354_000138200 [Cercospora kikuchii]GIZ37954.1 hypothetical protein CKM354_000138200 [Cercospora kikuchii]
MTAVASSFQPATTKLGWTEEIRMFGPRRNLSRQNSSSSIASTASSTSTISATSTQSNGAVQPVSDTNNWAARKKPTRGLWPPGKSEPVAGISTARPQPVSATTSGATASSAISALHAPLLPSQQMANGSGQANGVMAREQVQQMPPAILHLSPMNGTFERKTITVPYAPDCMRIGRQTNQKTVPSPVNGYFDSKVLSRQHAEIYADRQGRIFIRDVKSSNGTFVNGMRLSQENKESEPRELREHDVLELGIDIVSEDQKTVVHHKVAAKVESAGVYPDNGGALNFGDLDPSGGQGFQQQFGRRGSQGSVNSRVAANPAVSQAAMGMGLVNQPQHMRNWLNPITTEHIVRKLNYEMKLAMQQSQEIARARQAIENMLGGKLEAPAMEKPKSNSEKSRPSPTRSKLDLKAHFSEPPAPPPQAPLPEKPDVARALADPLIQPLLRRSDTARPSSSSSSPTRNDHSSDILRLCEELKSAKGELSNQSERMKTLENELAQERLARESAEERAQRLEQADRRDSPTNDGHPSADNSPSTSIRPTDVISDSAPEVQIQLDRLRTQMDEMKQQMEAYRQRAEKAESERDETKQTLAEMVEEKRRQNAEQASEKSFSLAKAQNAPAKSLPQPDGLSAESNGHILPPASRSNPTPSNLLQRAGVEEGRPITPEQAKMLTQFLAREVIGSDPSNIGARDMDKALLYYGVPYGSFAAVVIVGFIAMNWINGWPKIER